MTMDGLVQFLSSHGYAVLFVTVLAEQIGLPVPSGLALLAAGALAAAGSMSFFLALMLATVACLSGDVCWFVLGKRRGRSILATLCRISLEPDTCVRRTEQLFAKNRVKSLLFSKFVPGLGTVAPPMAGILDIGTAVFILFDGLGAVLWSSCYLLGGFIFKTEIEKVAAYLRSAGASLLGMGVTLACLYVVSKLIARRKFYKEIRMARITPLELKALMESGQNTIIVDLRHSQEWDGGMIPGALLVSDAELDDRFAADVPQGEVVFYCS